MKKIAIAVLIIGLGFNQVNAQSFIKRIADNLSGGFKVEANMSNFFLSDMPGAKSKMNIGGTLGAFVKLDMSAHFAIQEDVLVHYKTSTLEQGVVKNDYQYSGIEIPIYAMGQWKMSKGDRFYIGVGPCPEYGIDAKYTVGGNEIDLYQKDVVTGKAPMAKLNVGAGAIMGYEFGCGIQVNAGYKMGLTNTLDEGKANASMRPNTVSFGIGYRF